MSSVDPALQAAALTPPRAFGDPPARGIVRAVPEDFVVEEELGFAPHGSGAHRLLKVRKRDANTGYVAREIARIAGCRPADVGYAGLKDRRALTVQWFSVPAPRTSLEWTQVREADFEVLEAHCHHRKLPRGALAGNRFAIRVRVEQGSGAQLAARLAPRLAGIAQTGVPNYFGPQRFGRAGANLARTQAALSALSAAERGFILSAARSVVFNAVLAQRVAAATWNAWLAGDVANLDGRGSVFAVQTEDPELAARGERLEIHPTGPLWGRGEPGSAAAVANLECEVAAQFASQCALCVDAGMRQERRSLRLQVRELACAVEEEAVLLRFYLTRGAFATAVLRELIQAQGELAEGSSA